jgi:DNA-directed RNA polymerase subunit RPC12/RpoP
MKEHEVKCTNCKYRWVTKAKLAQVTCPNCGYKTLNKEPKYKVKGSGIHRHIVEVEDEDGNNRTRDSDI